MIENEAKERCDLLINSLSVNNGVESAFRNDFNGYMDFTTMREFAQTCKKALEEVEQYQAIGTPEELRSIKENGAFTGMELAQLAAMQMRLKEYEKIGTPKECQTAMELYNKMLKRKFTIEAVEESMKFEDELVGHRLTFSNLIDLMEKNTPKKPRFNGKNWYRCHNGCEVHTVGFRRDWYCPNCGQRIDWEGVED